jgi:two-component sensor histidine kinase
LPTSLAPPQDALAAENADLRLLLVQAELNAQVLLEQAGIDAKERAASDKLQKLILEELHHRIKNTLATVSAITRQSLRTASDLEHAQSAIEGRLVALGRAHDLLLQQWTSADLEEVIRAAIEPFDDKEVAKFSISGPRIQIASGAVISFAMALNELCTNTTKFGALSVPNGRVDIAWTLDEAHLRLNFSWTEKHGPVVQAPAKQSFGTRLITSLGKQLNADARLTYEPSGLVYALDVPMTSLTLPTAA